MIQLIVFTEVDDLAENAYMTLTELALSVKIVNFFLRSRSMQTHLRTVKHFQLCSHIEREYFSKRAKFVLHLLLIDTVLTNTAHLFIQLKTLVATERMLAFPAWQPLEWETNSRNYWLIFVYQLIAMIITSNIQVVIQQYPTLLFCMVSTQMEILCMRLRNMGYKNVQTNESSVTIDMDEINVPKSDTSIENLNLISKNLKDCMKTHHEILR